MNPCKFPACDRNAIARGWCTTHYQRWRRTGTPDDPKAKADVDRIVELVGLGLSHREIAGAIGVHPTTVRKTIRVIRRRAGVATKAELAELMRAK